MTLIADAQASIGAVFKIRTQKEGESGWTDLTDWSTNLVTDWALDMMATAPNLRSASVYFFEDSSVPQASHRSADMVGARKHLASNGGMAYSLQASSTRDYTAQGDWYYYTTLVYTETNFGAVSGTWSKIGLELIHHSSDNQVVAYDFFDFALLKDLNGNPVTINVAANEKVQVYVELRVYPPMEVGVQYFNLTDGDNNIVDTIKVNRKFSKYAYSQLFSSDYFTSAGSLRFSLLRHAFNHYGSNLSGDEIFVRNPQNTNLYQGDTLSLQFTKTTNLAERSATVTSPVLGSTLANGTWSHLYIQTILGEVLFDWRGQSFTKDNTHTIQFSVKQSVNRYIPNTIPPIWFNTSQIESAQTSITMSDVIRTNP